MIRGMCVCVCLHMRQSKSISTAFYICVLCQFPWYMFVCVHVCAPKGEVYFNIVSHEAISMDFIPSTPTYFFILSCLHTTYWREGAEYVVCCVTYLCLAMSLMLVIFMASIAPDGPQILAWRGKLQLG